MKGTHKHRQHLTKELQKVLDTHQEAKFVSHRYRTIRATLLADYPNLVSSVDKELMLSFLKDAIYLDRKLRKLTEGVEEEVKEVLSEEFQIEEGYEVGFNSNVRQIKNITE